MNTDPPTGFVCSLRRTLDTRKLFILKRSILDLDNAKVEWVGRREGNTWWVVEGGGRKKEVGRETVAAWMPEPWIVLVDE